MTSPALPYGPYTCATSLVWREAVPGDYVCVPPGVRTRASQDNAAAASRVQPGGGAYGDDTCTQGYVWRESRPSDHVCVPPPTRTYTWNENANAVYGYADPTGLPANGTNARWEGQLHVWGSGFTPNRLVDVWSFDSATHAYSKSSLPLRADGSGQLDGFATRNSTQSDYRSVHVLIVDPATGLVRNAGRVNAPNFW
ncbi:hypothetical protein [Streptomyces sp. NPDC005907]|uniref:hypothetical protein n=1 Tax=Streptomyces sp. NPDC005907 TaxID=3154571 RepID=UPI0034078242